MYASSLFYHSLDGNSLSPFANLTEIKQVSRNPFYENKLRKQPSEYEMIRILNID